MAGAAAEASSPPAPAVERLMSVDDALALVRRHLDRGELGAAEAVVQQIAQRRKRHPDVFHLLGVIAFRQGRLDRAIAFAERAIALAPRTAAFWSNLAEMLRRRGYLERGFEAARRSVELDPKDARAFNNLGIVEFDRGGFPQAVRAYRKALALDEGFAQAWNNLGNALVRLGQDAQAHVAYERAIHLQPRYGEAMVNDALCYRDEARFGLAEERLRQAIAAQPRNANAHLSLAVVKFLTGETEEARREYEWRLALPRAAPKGLPGRPWRGEDLAGKRLFLFAEQGLGDTIQSLRYMRRLLHRGPASLSLFAPRALRRLVEQNFPHIVLPGKPASAGEADYYCALMSLPLRLEADEADRSAGLPYLKADPARAAHWRLKLADFSGRKVGLVWAGNSSYQNDHQRSMPAANFAPLLDLPDTSFFSLQIGPAAAQFSALKAGAHDLGDGVSSMAETAAAISALDLVISVDTSLAHLAGALGTPVWTLLPHVPDWRWGMSGESSALYRSMRLFRQQERRDWQGVIRRVGAALLDENREGKGS
jgi:Flp pilus assembly protein TadD